MNPDNIALTTLLAAIIAIGGSAYIITLCIGWTTADAILWWQSRRHK